MPLLVSLSHRINSKFTSCIRACIYLRPLAIQLTYSIIVSAISLEFSNLNSEASYKLPLLQYSIIIEEKKKCGRTCKLLLLDYCNSQTGHGLEITAYERIIVVWISQCLSLKFQIPEVVWQRLAKFHFFTVNNVTIPQRPVCPQLAKI